MPRPKGESAAARKTRRERARTSRAQREEAAAAGAVGNVLDSSSDRAGLILIRRAIRGGWKVPPHLLATLPAVVQSIAESADQTRDRLRAIELLISMDKANTDALQAADRCERLDGGTATDRVELSPITLRPGGGSGAA